MRWYSSIWLMLLLMSCGGIADIPSIPVGFAKPSDSMNNIPAGTVFTVPGKALIRSNPAHTITVQGKFISDTMIAVTEGGVTNVLTYDKDKDNFSSVDELTSFTSAQSLFLSDVNRYIKAFRYNENIKRPQTNIFTNTTTYETTYSKTIYGHVGYEADPTALTGTAVYTGPGQISVGASGYSLSNSGVAPHSDSANGTMTLNVDFINGTLNGQLDFADPTNGPGGPSGIDLGTFTIPIPSGTITGNRYSADLTLSASDLDLAYVAQGTLDGAFYGPSGEHVAGTAVLDGHDSGATNGYVIIQATGDR